MVIYILRFVPKNNKHFFKVQESADILNISADTIRRWEKKGLIKSRRNASNHRLFSLEELQRVQKKMNGDHSDNHFRVLTHPQKTNYTSIELFAGAGGTALGLENAGIKHVLLNELDDDCVETLLNNRPHWNVLHKNVSQVSFKQWRGKVDIIQGGFPCQSFSYAGKKGGFEDTRGTLFYEFARAIKEVQPKIAVGENVRGLLRHDKGKTLSTMVSVLQNSGYKVAYKVLRAQYLDVPQKRERLIILAIRNDLNIPFTFPKERNYFISLKEALENVPPSEGQEYSQNKSQVLDLVPPGGYWKDLPVEVQKKYMGRSYYLGGGKTGMARRLSWNEPSLTLTCSPAQKQTERCHPEETRPLTIREYARIQTFPDDWQFSGSITSQYKQIGNAVPVNMGYHLGRALIAMLDGVKNDDAFESFSDFSAHNNIVRGSSYI